MSQGFPPQGGQGFRPQGGQGFVPQGNQGFTPQGGQGFVPQGNQGFTPQGGQGFVPQGNQGFTPQGGQGYGPQGGYQNNQQYQPYPNIQSPMVWSILSTVFCCLPFGIVSIVYAAKVNSLLAVGNFREAKIAADNAKKWAWIAFGLGLVGNILYLLAVVASEM